MKTTKPVSVELNLRLRTSNAWFKEQAERENSSTLDSLNSNDNNDDDDDSKYLFSTYVPGTVSSSLHLLTHIILMRL